MTSRVNDTIRDAGGIVRTHSLYLTTEPADAAAISLAAAWRGVCGRLASIRSSVERHRERNEAYQMLHALEDHIRAVADCHPRLLAVSANPFEAVQNAGSPGESVGEAIRQYRQTRRILDDLQ